MKAKVSAAQWAAAWEAMNNRIDINSALATRIVGALQQTGSADDLRIEYIANNIRELHRQMNIGISEYRLDGRDVIDLLCDKACCEVIEKEPQQVYSSNIYYRIKVSSLEVRFCMNLRQGEECHTGEFFYYSRYLFNAVFMTPEEVVDLLLQASVQYEGWMKEWNKVYLKCRKTAKLKQLSESAIDAYLKLITKETSVSYYTVDRKNVVEVYFHLHWGMKYMITVKHSSFKEKIDEAVARVEDINRSMDEMETQGRHLKLTYKEDWQNSITL